MPILDKWTLDFISSGVEQTVRLGVRLGELLEPGDVLCLFGDLGRGKRPLLAALVAVGAQGCVLPAPPSPWSMNTRA